MQNLICSCDVCDMEKGQSNDWLLAGAHPRQFVLLPWEAVEKAALLGADLHICGQECAHKLLSQWLDDNITRPTPANSQETV